MQVIETLAEGLKRELKVVIPADEMQTRMNERLAEVKDRVRINGFRPGKVPVAHLKKVYGKSIMAELVNEIVRDKPTEILTGRGEKSATQPEVAMTEDEAEADKILKAEADFEFTLAYEIIRGDRAQGCDRHQGDPRSRRDRRRRSQRADPAHRRKRPDL
ncbi:FKBP-type peptidyl-prolyl cis-trans isomerase (trigger factor) [Sinorhizobium fredii]